MNKLSKYGQNRLIIGLISLLSMSFLASAPFESNPQDCEMISSARKKNKDAYPADDDENFLQN
jgi:hypothetical protein